MGLAAPAVVLLSALPPVQRAVAGQPPRQVDSGYCRGDHRSTAPAPGREDSGPSASVSAPDCPRLPGLLGVAHNAGTRPAAARRALAEGAEVIEVDLVDIAGGLRAGHDDPLPVVGEVLHRGATLGQAWRTAAPARVLLDLKGGGSGADAVAAFLRAHHDPARPALVTSRDATVVERLAEQVPQEVDVLITVANPSALQRLRDDPGTAAKVDGLSIYEGLLDPATVRWATSRGWFLMAWTVNDVARAQVLARIGVDAVVTDDAALLRAMSGP